MKPESEAIINNIIELIRQLSASERRILQRRLRISGLVETEELVSDRNRLHVATALGTQIAELSATEAAAAEAAVVQDDDPTAAPKRPAPKRPAPKRPDEVPPVQTSEPDTSPLVGDSAANADAAQAAVDNHAGNHRAGEHLEEMTQYHSPVSGKVVVGAPGEDIDELSPDPHLMSPLPGLAPEQPIRVVFDGGSKGNPGIGYGSYALDWPGLPRQIVQLQFGNRVTNNEAEYDTLIAALEGLVTRLEDQDADVATAQLDIRGDSELVIKQVRGEYQCKNNRMRVRRDRVIELLEEFDDWSLIHHDRENSVRILGH